MSDFNYHCRWRIELAKQICEKLEGIAGIKAVVVGGSVARGFADEYSDVEIPVFWEKYPCESTRKQIIKELNADYFYPYNHEAREDNIIINGLRIDLWHISAIDEEDTIKSVIENFDISYGSSNAMDTLRACIPLLGDEIVYHWKSMAKEYPKEIAINNIRESLQSIDCTQVELSLQRENPTLVYEQIISLQKSIFIILLALNKEYFPTFKWMYKSMETLNIKPKGIENKFRDTFTYPPRVAFESTINILLEIFKLINEIYPEINTDFTLSKLKSARVAQNYPITI